MSKKRERLSEQIKEVVAKYVVENAPPDIGIVSITRVELTKDGSRAKVFFTVLPEENADKVKTFLEEHKRNITEKIKRFRVKVIPKLEFEEDKETQIMEKLWNEQV
ncbi:ribosome-binding factor A [Aquifex sp.]